MDTVPHFRIFLISVTLLLGHAASCMAAPAVGKSMPELDDYETMRREKTLEPRRLAEKV